MSLDGSKPILFAHRGAAAEYPENTLESFRRALDLGADALEMDVHMTADGEIVVSHDPNGKRMCGVDTDIRSALWSDVRQWDAGHGYEKDDGTFPYRGGDCRIPTLEQVIEEFPGVLINVDIKQGDPPMVPQVLAVLRRMEVEERVVLASFRLRTMLWVRSEGYKGLTALSQSEVAGLLVTPRLLWKRIPLVGVAAQIPVKFGPVNFASERVIGKCHDLGMRVDFWTINDPEEADRLLELGADGIMTDDPAAIVPVFEARGLR